MTGLVLKDAYTALKETRLFLLLIAVIVFLQNDFLFAYVIFYSAMIPITVLGYDERSKWHKLADMLPVSTGQIVASKYLTGYLSVGAAFILVVLGRLFGALAGNGMPTIQTLGTLSVTACVSIIIQAVHLPLMFWIGVERGRLLFVLITVCSIVGYLSLLENLTLPQMHTEIMLLPALLIITVILSLISCQISKAAYNRHK